MHFAYTRPGGIWSPFSVLLSAELADLDQKTFKAINGDDGGTFSPSSVITIGGQGITITGPSVFSGTFTVQHSANIGSGFGDFLVANSTFVGIYGGGFGTSLQCGTTMSVGTNLTVGGTSLLTGLASFSNGIAVTGSSAVQAFTCSTLATSSNAFIAGTLHAAGNCTFDGVTQVNGAFQTNGTLTATGSMSATNGLTVTNGASFTSGAVAFSGTARPARPAVVGTSASTTITPTVANEYYFGATLAADTTVQISDTGAVDGDWLEVFNASTAHTVSINDPGGSLLITIKNATTQIDSVRFKRIAGTWTKLGVTHVP